MRNRDCMAASMLTLLALGGPRAWCCAHVACAGLSDRFIGTARHATSALPSCFVHRLRGGGRGGRRGGRRGGGRGGEAEPAGPRTRASPGHFMDCEDPVAGPEIWKSAFLCGTELEQMEEVYRIKWDFSHLDAALQDGPLSLRASIAEQALPTKVFLFGSTEPQMFPLDENTTTVVHIPVIVAVKTSVDLPSKLGLNSVQMTSEQIVDMVQFKMSWAPLEVAQNRVAGSDTAEIGASPTKRGRHLRDVGRVFALQCTQRKGRGTLKNLAEERTRSFDYCMPYIFLPHKAVEDAPDTSVEVMCELPGRSAPLLVEFDWELDEVGEVVAEKTSEEGLTAAQAQTLSTDIKQAVAATKARRKEERLAKARVIQEMGEERRQALRDIRVFKFYPRNEKCQTMKSKYVNRYYGQADEIVA